MRDVYRHYWRQLKKGDYLPPEDGKLSAPITVKFMLLCKALK
jgi:hypothetical protein